MNKIMKNVALWLIILLLLVALFNLFQSSPDRARLPPLAYSDFVAEVNKGEVTDVLITGKVLSFHLADGRAGATMAPDDPGLIQRLLDKKVRMLVARGDEDAPSWLSILVSWLPFFAIAGFWFYILRRCLRQLEMLTETVGRIASAQAAGSGDAKREIAATAASPRVDEAGGDEGTPG